MKTFMLGLMMMGFAGAALAIEPATLDNRVLDLAAKFETLQARADRGIPADVLQRAQGIILLDRTRAGFLFAYEGGGGVAMARDAKTGAWGPVAFVGASEASLGFQIGGEKDFYAILLMSRDAERVLTEPNYKFGGEARGTAGETSSGHQAKVTTMNQPVLVYSLRKGLYGGAAIQGGSISPDDKANRIYYNQALTMRDILFDHRVQASESATDLARKIDGFASPPAAVTSAPPPTAPAATVAPPSEPPQAAPPPPVQPAAPVTAPAPPANNNPPPPPTNAPNPPQRIPVTD
ncbi:MAG TPA: lipid-binding SYLF domain-containing protein, partial [Candidatus Cybelea sp.]|nr:lipid-binding SYLF domain-containing protein [Candidatus Cybelea sp.]